MAVAAALLRQPTPVYATDSGPDQPNTADQQASLQEVTVTATRRTEDIQSVPFNLEAINSDMIQELHANVLDDIVSYLPGVSLSAAHNNYGSSQIITRGLNVSTQDPGYSPPNGIQRAVATYLGEVPLYYDFKLTDIDRVEALLGPQGTLYGAGTLGGVIRYVPKQPNLSSFEADVHVRGAYQEYAPTGGYDADAVLNLPLVDGVLGFRAAVSYVDDAGFINNTRLLRDPGVSNPQPNFNSPNAIAENFYTLKGVNYDHGYAARAELLYKPADTFDAELTYMHQRDLTGGVSVTRIQPEAPALFQQVLDTGPFDDAVRVPETADRTADVISLVLTAHLGSADLTSASSHATRKIQQIADNTDAFLYSNSYADFPKFVEWTLNLDESELYTQDVRLVSNGQSRLNWIVGGFYQYTHDYLEPSYYYAPGYPAFIGVDRPDQLLGYANTPDTSSDKAVFGEVGYQFTPAWQATIGGRYFKDAFSTDNIESFPLICQPCSPPNGLNVQTEHFNGPSVKTPLYKFNTSYRFTPDLMAYATFDTGYRQGGVNNKPACPPGVHANCLPEDELVWKPDRTRNYEVGIRSTWFDKRLLVNADYYLINWTDLRVGAVNQYDVNFFTNGSAARSYGLEMQFQAQLSSHWSVLGSYTHEDAYMTKDTPSISAVAGDRLPNSPRDYGALHLRYSVNLPDNYAAYATYGVKVQGNSVTFIGGRTTCPNTPDDSYSTFCPGFPFPSETVALGGYAVSDASLGLSRGNWNVNFFVENLFNRYAYTQFSDAAIFPSQNVYQGWVQRFFYRGVVPPRLFGLEFSMHFGPH